MNVAKRNYKYTKTAIWKREFVVITKIISVYVLKVASLLANAQGHLLALKLMIMAITCSSYTYV